MLSYRLQEKLIMWKLAGHLVLPCICWMILCSLEVIPLLTLWSYDAELKNTDALR